MSPAAEDRKMLFLDRLIPPLGTWRHCQEWRTSKPHSPGQPSPPALPLSLSPSLPPSLPSSSKVRCPWPHGIPWWVQSRVPEAGEDEEVPPEFESGAQLPYKGGLVRSGLPCNWRWSLWDRQMPAPMWETSHFQLGVFNSCRHVRFGWPSGDIEGQIAGTSKRYA